MEYREIVAVTGLGGLFQLLATKSDGAIVRNLADKSTRFISARLHNVTPLESIEIYTTGENVRLHDVFEKMKELEEATPPVDGKKADGTAIKSYFKAVFPDLDEERVYLSDMKKMLRWYEILKGNDLLDFSQYKEAVAGVGEDVASDTEVPVEETVQLAKKPRAKKSTAAKEEEADVEKPVKKAAPKKKKTTEGEQEADTAEKPAKKTAPKKKKTEE